MAAEATVNSNYNERYDQSFQSPETVAYLWLHRIVRAQAAATLDMRQATTQS